MTDEIVSELELILSEYQLLDIRLANIIEFLRQEINAAIEKREEKQMTKTGGQNGKE